MEIHPSYSPNHRYSKMGNKDCLLYMILGNPVPKRRAMNFRFKTHEICTMEPARLEQAQCSWWDPLDHVMGNLGLGGAWD